MIGYSYCLFPSGKDDIFDGLPRRVLYKTEPETKTIAGVSKHVTKEWLVYALVESPDGAPFYIGCSHDPNWRIEQHAYEPGSLTGEKIRECRARGATVTALVLSKHESRVDALAEEARLIKSTPGLLNIISYNGPVKRLVKPAGGTNRGGRPRLGTEVMTAAERVRKSRASKRAKA